MTIENETATALARDAATVMVLRERREETGLEVFMVRRHARSRFMANTYVYPGGKLDEADTSAAVADHVVGLDPAAACERLLDVKSPSKALGLYLAGVRETFEEAGFLLARRRGASAYIDLVGDEVIARRFADHRRALHDGSLSLSALADVEALEINLEYMGYFAHWITPYFESRRFDTRFFIALAPPNQLPLHDAVETTDSLWISPGEAIDRYRRGEFVIAPPTLRTLEQLAVFDTPESALAFTRNHCPPAILPHLKTDDDEVALLLPGDPQFPSDDPLYKRATPVDDGVTRMVMRDGIWDSV